MNYFCPLYSTLMKLNLFKQKNYFIISIFTLSFSFYSCPEIFSQVKIKESIVITPGSISTKHLNSISSSSHTIRLIGEWDQTMLGEDEDIPLNRQRFKISTSCGDDIYSDFDYSGYTEFNFTAEYGDTYNIQFLNAQRTLWNPSYQDEGIYGGQFEVYVDGQYFTTANNSIDITPWFSSLGFQIYGNNIYHGSSLNIGFTQVQSCEPIIGSVSNDWPEISIVKGKEYLSFYDEVSEDTLGDSFYFGDFISNTPKLLYDNPYYKDGELNGILKAELNGISTFDTLQINKLEDFELIVGIEPEELRPGESADIHLLQDLGFDQEEFPPEQLFKVEIIDGSQYGTIVAQNGTDTSDVFDDILQGFTFRASENIVDSAEVYIKVSTVLENEVIIVSRDHSDKSEMNKTMTITKNDAVNPDLGHTNLSNNNPNWIFFPPEENREIYGIGKVIVKNDDIIEIMLGESKYFQAIYPDPTTDNLVIEEVRVGDDGIPHLEGGLPLDTIWAGNPVAIVNNSDTSGRRCGVYWETQKPVWVDTTNMGYLQNGLIRIIGRYWHSDSSYVAKLKARRNGDSTELKLKVIKPNYLLTEGRTDTLNKYVDINSNVINIDSLIIQYAGQLGIPPHFIKGHISKEAATEEFEGEIGRAFTPGYRYEPYTVQFWNTLESGTVQYGYYFEDSASVDYTDVPYHENVNYLDYITETSTVWDIIINYSQLVNPEANGVFGSRNANHTMNYPREYTQIRARYYDLLNYYSEIFTNIVEAADSANSAMARWFENSWRPPFQNRIINPQNVIAQTRVASSYGLLQVLYTTGLWRMHEVTRNIRPENMNEIEYTISTLREQKRRLISGLGINVEKDNNWTSGFEAAFRNYVFTIWNTHHTYANAVQHRTQYFLPHR